MSFQVPTVGIDIVDLSDFKKAMRNEHFLNRVFTSTEIDYCSKKADPIPSLAGRFAAKEAVMKALSPFGKMPFFSEIEILKQPNGAISAHLPLHPGIQISLNLSHGKQCAVAVAIAYVSDHA